MTSTFRNLRLRLRRRADSEHEQAVIRIAIVAMVWAYLWFTYSPKAANSTHEVAILVFLAADVAFSTLIFLHILAFPGVSRARRAVGMVNDAVAATTVMFLTGEAGASMIGVYLFITFGNGFRYGRAYLFACQSLCLAGYAAVLAFADYWQVHQTVGWSLMVALVVLPLYVSTLLTRIEQARAKAEEANRAKSTFLANMSHEMRTPLNGILGAIELFRTTELDTRQVELTRLLQHSVGLLRALVDDVLDISKIEAGRLTIEIADFDLHAMLNGLIGLLRPHARSKGLTLAALVDPAIDYHMRGDAHHLSQVLLNLLSNAIKFTEKGGVDVHVRLKAHTEAGLLVRFEVVDTGIGMSEEAQKRIFERFVQADDSTTRRFGGTGLGTTIARQLVQLMGGSIGVVSTLDKGSTFWFEVPLLAASAADAPASGKSPLAVVVARPEEQQSIRDMAAGVFDTAVACDPQADVPALLDELAAGGRQPAALFFAGDMEAAQGLFTRLAEKPSNASMALIYVTSAADYSSTMLLREIDGVNLVGPNTPARLLKNAIHAATSKGASVGQVIDLRAVLEEQRQPLRILVAEDNVTNQQIIRQLLEKAGHQVSIAADGEAALDLYEAQSYDIAILDFNMPERNGIEVAKAIRVMEPSGTRMPIMILSATVSTEAREQARRAGADEFVGKPYEAAQLLQAIDRMARRSRAQKDAATAVPASASSGPAIVESLARRTASPLVDFRRIGELERIGGSHDFLERLLEGFQSDTQRLLVALRECIDARRADRIGEVTHAIKGAALGIGASRLAEHCRDIERMTAAGWNEQLPAAASVMQALVAETNVRLREAILDRSRAASS